MTRFAWCIHTVCTRAPTDWPKDVSERKWVSIDATCCDERRPVVPERAETRSVSLLKARRCDSVSMLTFGGGCNSRTGGEPEWLVSRLGSPRASTEVEPVKVRFRTVVRRRRSESGWEKGKCAAGFDDGSCPLPRRARALYGCAEPSGGSRDR